jgi:hypothetical protein
VSLEASASLFARLFLGVDKYWLQSIRNNEDRTLFDSLANSVYLDDGHDVAGAVVDLPEFEMDLSPILTAGAILENPKGLSNLHATIFGGLNFGLEADLTGDDSGKLRFGDLLESALDLPDGTGLSSLFESGSDHFFALVGHNILNIFQLKGALGLTAGGGLGLGVDLVPEDKSNLGEVTRALSEAYASNDNGRLRGGISSVVHVFDKDGRRQVRG